MLLASRDLLHDLLHVVGGAVALLSVACLREHAGRADAPRVVVLHHQHSHVPVLPGAGGTAGGACLTNGRPS